MPIILFRDYESRSTLNLKKVGAYRYAAHPTTDVWCVSYAVDDGEIKTWVPGDPVPLEWIEASQNPNWSVSAFNNFFERMIEQHIMAPRYGWPLVPIERHRCTQASALAMALPESLEDVARALGLPHQKDKAGAENMRLMAKPRKPLKGEDPSGIYWFDDPANLKIQYAYNRRDVEVERAIHHRIGHISPEEQALWELNEAINDRGVFIDYSLVTAAVRIADAALKELNNELEAVTDGAITSAKQTVELVKWLGAHDCRVPNIGKETVAEALTRKGLSPKVRRVLELRRDGACSASSKFKTMMAWRNSDDRIRGGFKYHGCHTGRFSSYGVQFQNFKKPLLDDMNASIAAVMTGDLEKLRNLDPQPLSALGDVTRATVCAEPGHEFFAGDFSGVESRVLAYLANERAKLALWAKFDASGLPEDDVYFIEGVQYFGFPPEQARPFGKTGDLAFGFGGGEPAWRKFAPRGDQTSKAAILRYQAAWRAAHPMTDRFWSALGHGTLDAMRTPGKTFACGKHIGVKCDEDGAFLRIRLPSGRENAYPAPRLMTTSRGEQAVTYLGAPKDKKTKEDRGAWYGLWCENVVQAAARDLLTAAMLRLDAHGYKIVAHIHDEIVCEVPADTGDIEEFKRIITALPEWASGMPMAVKVRKGDRFCEIKAAPASAETANAEPRDVHEVDAGEPVEPENTSDQEPNTENSSFDAEDTCESHDNTEYGTFTHDDDDGYSTKSKRPFGRIEAHYIYLDERGALYGRVTRTSTKRFAQARWENGKWVNKAPVPRIPYRLPELVAAPLSEPVFICEGEKDAINVAALTLIATTNPGGGIPKTWTCDLNRWFAGRIVYICEDNDKTGRTHVNEVARALKGIAKEIRIVEFHDLPEHGDVSDWIAQGGTAEDLLKRAKAGHLPHKGYTLVRAVDIVPRATDYLWEGHLARGALELLTGVPGVGKSQIQDAYVACTTTGRIWPNGTNGSTAQNVIMMTAEDVLDQTVIPRLIAAGADLGRVSILKSIRRDNEDDRMFLLAEDLGKLQEMITEVGNVGLVCIDPITAYMGGKIDSHRATDVRSVLGPLKDLAEHTQVPFSAITHPAKNASQKALDHFIGSQAYIAVARLGHSCIDEMEEDATGLRQLSGRALFTNPKNSLGKLMPSLAYRIVEATISPLGRNITVSKIDWEEVVEITADEALAEVRSSERRAKRDAVTFLLTILASGPVLKKVIEAEAERQGISEKQLRSAREKMGLISYRRKGQVSGGTIWAKPQDAPPKGEIDEE